MTSPSRISGAIALALAGCAITEDATTEDTSTASQDLLGADHYGSDCTPGYRAFLDDTMSYGRVAAASPAFAACMASAVTGSGAFVPIYGGTIGPYRRCIGDPFYSSTPASQLSAVMTAARSGNSVTMNCTGGAGNASAQIGTYGHSDPEALSWSGWLDAVYNDLSMPVCGTAGSVPGACRPPAWPMSQAAGIVWHEAMHSQGYTHGGNDQASGISACGYSGDPTWNYQVNTMPYIVGNCINNVIDQSTATCGSDLRAGCRPGELRLVSSLTSSTCSCIHDPRIGGIALLAPTSSADPFDTVHEGEWMGGWHYGPGNPVVGVGDFDGDGRADFVIRSGWGLGFVKRSSAGVLTLFAAVAWGTVVDGVAINASDTLVSVGRFTSDPKAELMWRTAGGIYLLSEVGGVMHVYDGVPFGSTTSGITMHATDRYDAFGDFDGDGIRDFIDGGTLKILRFNRISGWPAISQLATVAAGTYMGAWGYNTTDTILGVGDFDGDNRDDFIIKSAWGIGTIHRTTTGALTQLNMQAFGSYWGSWGVNATDTIVTTIDVNGDNRDELVVRSGWGLGILSRSSTGAAIQRSGTPYGGWIDGWHLGTSDSFPRSGDFNGDGRGDLVVRSAWGIGILAGASTGSFTGIFGHPYADAANGWQVPSTINVLPPGDFDGDGDVDLFLQQ